MSLRILGRTNGAVSAQTVYNPSHDINNYFPAVAQHVGQVLSDRSRWPGWTEWAFRLFRLDELTLARTYYDFLKACRIVRDSAFQVALDDAFHKSGFQEQPYPARILVFAMIGQTMIGSYWTARREANTLPILNGPPDGITTSLQEYEKGVAARDRS